MWMILKENKKKTKKEQPQQEEELKQAPEAEQLPPEPDTTVEDQPLGQEEETPGIELDPQIQAVVGEALQQAMDARAYATRIQVDFDNFRRRNANAREDAELDGKAQAITAMLPVLDNMERALQASEQTTDTALRDGVILIHKQMCDALAQLGVEEIQAQDQPFDPQLHHAVLQEEGGESGMVAQVMQKGYQMGERVLRYAMVKVYA